MRKTKLFVALFFASITCLISNLSAQNTNLRSALVYVFSPDSIAGFDEETAKVTAVNNSYYGQEFNYFMYSEKRNFINQKYNIRPAKIIPNTTPSNVKFYDKRGNEVFGSSFKAASMPSSGSCVNEDFEDATSNPGNQIGGAVNGWTLYGGQGSAASNFCNPTALSATNLYTVFNGPTIDPYMVAPTNTVSSYFSATSFNQPAGSCFIRLNDHLAGAKVVRLQKGYVVNANNALFRYAYRTVLSNPGHACCGQPGVQIKVTVTNTVTQASTVLACPQVSIAAGTSCGPAAPGFTPGNLLNGSPSAYNPSWVPSSLDLSAQIGFSVSIDVYAIDCSASGHAGYVYFDALCAPMTITGNGNQFPAGTPSINIPSCGATGGSTVFAPPGLGPYTWTSNAIGLPPGFGTPSNNNNPLVTTQSGTVAIIMNPPGSCAPITKTLNLITTPAPQALISVSNIACPPGPTVACVSLTTAGSATVTSNIIWNPVPPSLSNGSLQACGFTPTVGSVTVYDTYSCQVSQPFTITAAPPIPTFTLTNSSPSFSITCLNPSMNLSVVTTYTAGTANVNWVSSPAIFTSTNPGVTLTNTNIATYSVSLTDPATTCKTTQTFAVVMNTVAPTVSISPLTATINCNSSSPTFTATISQPTVNTDICWTAPAQSPVCFPNTSVSIFAPPPGTTFIVYKDNVNGCTSTRSVQVFATASFPTFNATSSSNFTLGCAPNHTTTICMAGASSTNGSVSYYVNTNTVLSVPYSSVLFSGTSCTTTSIPGSYSLVVRDNVSGCQTQLPIFIVQNTVQPQSSYSILTQTLTCKNPSVLAVGSSTTPNTQIFWNYPPAGPPNTINSHSLIVGPANGPATCSNCAGSYGIYTLTVVDGNNQCRAIQTVTINQDFVKAVPVLSISPSTTLTCFTPNAIASIISHSFGVAPTTNTFMIPNGNTFVGLSYNVTSIDPTATDIYTVMSTYNSNGCTGMNTFNIHKDFDLPVISSVPEVTVPCSGPGKVSIALTNTLSNWGVLLLNPLAAYSPTSLAVGPFGYTVSVQTATFTIDGPGDWGFTVTNLKNGCKETSAFEAVTGSLTSNFGASTTSGFAPLSVNFTNNTSVEGVNPIPSNYSLTTNWNFGNGAVATTTTYGGSPSTTYNNPGTYTVLMVSKSNSCIDSSYKIIVVDIPSKLEIPNVFTPNGDKNNDVFFLKTTNLTEVSALIFDRWGNKVYDLVSSTGNIAWDGKNQSGMDCAAGVYFYIIKAKGKDGNDYEQKGQVSLFR